MQDYGLVSIITCCFNAEQFIAQTIESVLAQSYPHWELLVTDDCSTDGSCAVVEKYMMQDQRIKLFHLEQNSGAGVARNNSIKEARGKYIAFLDSDDMWMPTKLEKQIAFMRKKDCVMCYSSYMQCNDEGEEIGIVVAPRKQSFFNIKCDDKIGCLTTIYDADKLGKVYLPTIRKRQDWGMKMMLLRKCKMAYGIKEPLAYYRIGHQSLSNKKITLVKYQIMVYKEVLNWSTLRASLFLCFVFFPSYFFKRLELKFINR